jgi:NhaP-type Na+/H+ or K+/H+ antiporter
VLVVFLGILAYGLSDPIGGSGFIAAFVGGLSFGGMMRADYPDICDFSDGVSHLLTMASFFVFGALILEPVLEFVGWRYVLYAALSLTIVRMVPVAVSLVGTGLRPQTVAYVGWFGPRGLASLVFTATIILQENVEPAREVLIAGTVTVAISVLLHGLTAFGLSQAYSRWFAAMGTGDEAMAMPEHREVEHVRRRRFLAPLRFFDSVS